MRVVELSLKDFDEFAAKHPLRNYCQFSSYAKFMGEKGFNYDYIGYQDDSNNTVAASLVLIKKFDLFLKYAYAPKGFLIDYYNTELLERFVKDICDYYDHKGMAFIKINPEIIIGELEGKSNLAPNYNQNVNIIDKLKDLGFKRRREVEPLDFIFPRISPYINLKKYNFNKLNDEIKENIQTATKSGLIVEKATNKDIGIFYEFIKNNTYDSIKFYRDMLNVFQDDAELLLLKVDYEDCLINVRAEYDHELEHNTECNNKIQENNNEKNIEEKMQSDRDLLALKNAIITATEGLKKNKYRFIGGALIIKYQNRVNIINIGYDKSFNTFNPIYFLYNSIIEKYKNDYTFLDLNGLASNFSESSPYYEYNQERLAFNPDIYEFIGEFDIILSDMKFNRIMNKGLMSHEFYPSYKK